VTSDASRRFARYPSLADRLVLVTGGGSDIGAALVEAFAANDARVAFVDILDEPSEGLAPIVVEALADQIAALKTEGMTLLMAEQNLALALALADRISILDKGHVRFTGSAEEFEADESLRQEYLTV